MRFRSHYIHIVIACNWYSSIHSSAMNNDKFEFWIWKQCWYYNESIPGLTLNKVLFNCLPWNSKMLREKNSYLCKKKKKCQVRKICANKNLMTTILLYLEKCFDTDYFWDLKYFSIFTRKPRSFNKMSYYVHFITNQSTENNVLLW